MTKEPTDTEHQEKLFFSYGSFDDALCDTTGRKRHEESTLITEAPYEDPKGPNLTKRQKRQKLRDFVPQLQGGNLYSEMVLHTSFTIVPTQNPKVRQGKRQVIPRKKQAEATLRR